MAKVKKKTFLIEFTYEYYCQGTEEHTTSVLVTTQPDFEKACEWINSNLKAIDKLAYNGTAYNFVNKTL